MSSFRHDLTPEVFNGRSRGELQVDRPGAAVLQSLAMILWFFGYFFYFPRPLAEGNG